MSHGKQSDEFTKFCLSWKASQLCHDIACKICNECSTACPCWSARYCYPCSPYWQMHHSINQPAASSRTRMPKCLSEFLDSNASELLLFKIDKISLMFCLLCLEPCVVVATTSLNAPATIVKNRKGKLGVTTKLQMSLRDASLSSACCRDNRRDDISYLNVESLKTNIIHISCFLW